MQLTKKNIRLRIADGALPEALTATFEYATQCGVVPVVNGLTVLTSSMEEHRRQWSSGQISYEEFSRGHARIAQSLVDWLDQLPEQPTPGAARKMVDETRFKKRVIWLLLLTKLLVIGRLWYHWSTGGFNNEQFMAVVGLLAPALAAYGAVVFSDYLQMHQDGIPKKRFVSGPLVNIILGVFVLYLMSLLFCIEQKAKEHFTFTQMTAGLVLIESMLGGYVSKVIGAFFKKEG